MNQETMGDITERAIGVVWQKAHDMLWCEMGTKRGLTQEALANRVWDTQDGQALRALVYSPYACLSYEDALDRITADGHLAHYAVGLAVVKSGRIETDEL